MSVSHLLVIADPDAPHLKILDKLGQNVLRTISLDEQQLLSAAPDAEVILNCTGNGRLLRPVFLHAPRLQWVHSLAAGVENQLFSELVDSPLPLTNSRGVFR